jgi:molybdate transport system substrate-binding protein
MHSSKKIPSCLLASLLAIGNIGNINSAVSAEISVAVASNFRAPMEKIAAQFHAGSGHQLLISYGASGKLYAHIKQGAPFDVFLSADSDTPRRLAAEGDALEASRFTYATGQLALWSAKAGYVDAHGAVLKTGGFRHLSIANPKTAPYGRAAMQTMQQMGLWEPLQARLVRAENIAQAHQFVASGNAELGFVALSQIIQTTQAKHSGNGNGSGGSYWLVPPQFHLPITQQAILLKHGRDKAAARQFLDFLKSPAAQTLIIAHGYAAPPHPSPLAKQSGPT